MAPAKNRAVFTESLLPAGQRRWKSFGAGLGLECLALLAVMIIPLFMPQKFEAVQHFWVTPVEAPVIQPWKPQPPPKPVIVKREVVKEIPKPVEVVPPKPKIYNPVITAPVAKVVVQKKVVQPDIQEAKAFTEANPLLGSSAIPNLKKPRELVQTGGFGDPNGVPANTKTDRNVNINTQGGFDMPTGPGNGNGTGGAKGARGVIASTGFGNGVAAGSPGGGGRGVVVAGGFSDESKAAAGPKIKQTAAVSNTKPVDILFKPKPVYTDEARNKKIEGDVVLQVVFTAAGEVKVERVVQGLGYGLDDAAESAARQIRFRPAEQEGQPVDFSALVHITFELAY